MLGGMDNAARVQALKEQVGELDIRLEVAENNREDPAIIEGIRRRLHSALVHLVLAAGKVSASDVTHPTLGPMILKEALSIPLPPSP